MEKIFFLFHLHREFFGVIPLTAPLQPCYKHQPTKIMLTGCWKYEVSNSGNYVGNVSNPLPEVPGDRKREGRSKNFKEWIVKGEEPMLKWSEYPFLSQVSCGRRRSSGESDSLVLCFGAGGSHMSDIWGYLYSNYYNVIKLWLQELALKTFTRK